MIQAHTFFQQALVYLLAAIIAVPIFKRCGLGSVLGFLIAGIIIGPWGLRLITDVNSIFTFAEFGVVLLLFLVGLELNPQRLWKLRRSILGMGSTQVVLTIAIFTLFGLILHLPLSLVIVAGMGFAMSSTAIALQTLTEKKLLSSPAGQASFSVLLFQDLAVIPLMILLSLLTPHTSTAHTTNWWNVAKAISIIAAFIAAGRFLLRPLLRIIANTNLREIFIAFSLLLVLGSALLMESIGLSMALGTFLAGVLLADSEYRYQLELDIEPFKGLLLGLFFIAIGMSIDIGLFYKQFLFILSLTLIVVAIKVILLYSLSRGFRDNHQDAQLFSVCLAQVGEFAFVLFNVAFNTKILTLTQTNILNAIVALSMLMTPILFMLYEKFILPCRKSIPVDKEADNIDEHNAVIIAGFGRVGGVISRLLSAKGIRATVIEHDPNQIELVRRFGFRAYYGDVTRLDLLHAAGAAQAKLLILAIDDSQASLEIARLVKKHFPKLKILARARSRVDAYEFVEEHIPAIRETFYSALAMGEAALQTLGYSFYTAHKAVLRFKKHDENILARAAKHRNDQQTLITLAHQGRAELTKILQREEHLRDQGDS